MFSVATSLVFASLVLSVASLTAPHDVRNVHRHRAIAVNVAAAAEEPVSMAQDILTPRPIRKRRSNTKRCRQRPKSSTTSLTPTGTPPAGQSLPVISSTSTSTSTVAESSSISSESTSSSTSSETSSTVTSSSSSSKAAPAPTSSQTKAPAPSSSSSKAAPTSTPPPSSSSSHTSSAPAPTSSSSSGGGNLPSYLTGTNTGQGTFYDPALGACGITNSNSDKIVAVSWELFDNFPGYTNKANPNTNPICNKPLTVHYQGKSVDVTVTDRCTGCAMLDLDFTRSAFDALADESLGRITGVTWSFN